MSNRIAIKKQLVKNILLLALQLAVYSCLWYGNVILASCSLLHLVSMDALCAAAKTNGGLFLDFSKNYACAQIAESQPKMIWDPSTQVATLNRDLHAQRGDQGILARENCCAPYTPQSVLLFRPLTTLPLNEAIILFQIGSLVFFLLTVTLLIKHYHIYSWPQIILWWFITLSAFPFMQNICLGQTTGLITGLLAVFFLTWRNPNVIFPALCLAITIAMKPQRALVMLVMSLALRRYRLLVVTFLFSIVFLVVCASLLGMDTILSYPEKVLSIETSRHALFHKHFEWTTSYAIGLSALLSELLPQSLGHWLTLGLAVLDLGIIYAIWRIANRIGAQSFPFAFAASVPIDLVLGPYEPPYDILLITVIWAVTVKQVGLPNFAQLKDTWSRLWFLVFSFFPVFSWLAVCYYPKIGGILNMIFLTALAVFASSELLSLHRAHLKSGQATLQQNTVNG